MRMLAGRIWRDHGLDTACGQFVAQAPGIVSSIGQQAAWVAAMPIKPRAPTKSWVLPGVIRKASGRPTSSVSAWILVVCPPRERPIALLKAPLLRRPRSDGL